ncbi:hypothetical protein Ga0074812_103393 [Parafrankia irregularis]|uniref:Uncharacterized protein n=1 Tax=Parafrankia irregularis TaxID=795642 RepID=A0A0S4QHF1_9ACTN|nr:MULTISPECIES: hypothetical protein [Parafrankia]MBE3200713.1 hypothetical protein [Parafrankia sp. CH37]CUU54903.1 hypothetical protein Ga0074812_103393 [Parafrankia irregularis]
MESAVGSAGGAQRLFPRGDRLPDRLISGPKIQGLADRSSNREARARFLRSTPSPGHPYAVRKIAATSMFRRMTLVGTAMELGCLGRPHAEHLAPVVTRFLAASGRQVDAGPPEQP